MHIAIVWCPCTGYVSESFPVLLGSLLTFGGFTVIFRREIYTLLDLVNGSKDWSGRETAVATVSGKPQEHGYRVLYKSVNLR